MIPNGSGAPPNILKPPRSRSADGGGGRAPGNVGGAAPKPASAGFLDPYKSLGAPAVDTLQKVTKKNPAKFELKECSFTLEGRKSTDDE